MRFLLLLYLAIFLTSCGYNPHNVNIKPRSEPMYNYTQSSNFLECLGRYIQFSSIPKVDIYISNIPDHTIPTIESGFLTKNAVMMATTAVDRLNTDKVAVVGKDGGKKNRRQLQLLGSFTELNRTTKSGALSSEAIFPGGIELSFGADKNYNHIALDLALSEFNRIVPGTSTSVSVQIHGNSGDATLTYDEGSDFAAIGALGFTAQEGFHSAQRLLVETAVGLVISKYFSVNVKNCLDGSKKDDAPISDVPYDKPVYPARPYDNMSGPKESSDSDPEYEPLVIYDNNGGKINGRDLQQQHYYRRPSTYMNTSQSWGNENNVVILPQSHNKRYIYTAPEEYKRKESGSYAGQYNPFMSR